MKTLPVIQIFFVLLLSACGPSGSADPAAPEESNTLRLCIENPRYLEYMGEPLVLITSAEHYGAVLNTDFDYEVYLQTLHEEGFNYTRIFTGTYLEPVENVFGIRNNTLAPLEGAYLAPWISRDGKYDLSAFNPDYFARLKDFISMAREQGIIVEVSLFSSIYHESAWVLCPFHPTNNIQAAGEVPFRWVNSLNNGGLLEYQEAFVREVVRQLNDFDNFFFEIQNEPWADNPNMAGWANEGDERVFSRPWQKEVVLGNDISLAWQKEVASWINEEEGDLPKKHLVAQNISNFCHRLQELPAGTGMINFHYASPEAASWNLELGGVIGLDETGFMPREDGLYLDQAWRIMLSGAGMYNNLDYSFTTLSAAGTDPIPAGNPGWGGPPFRKKLAFLAEAMAEVPFVEMEFSEDLFALPKGGKQYALYKEGEVALCFIEELSRPVLRSNLPAGSYSLTHINVDSGERLEEEMNLDKNLEISLPFDGSRAAMIIRKQ